jgi:PEP-CTERM motif
MKKSLFKIVPLTVLLITIANSAQAAGLTTLIEDFNNINTLSSSGWAFQNNSNPAPLATTPTANWAQGVAGNPVNAQSGPNASYIFVGTESTGGDADGSNGQVSNWLLTPELDFSQGGTFRIYTRTFLGNPANERVDVRLSTAGVSTNVGSTPTSVGDFTTLLQTIGSLSTPFAYPGGLSSNNAYQLFTFTVAAGSGSGRIGFNYVGTDGGPNGTTSQFIAFDTASFNLLTPPVPEPSSALGLMTLGSFGLIASRRSKSKKAKA